MNTFLAIIVFGVVVQFMECVGEPILFSSEYEQQFLNNDVTCMCFDNNNIVTEFGLAFKVIQDSTTRLVNHMSDSQFNENTTDSYINTIEFKNYFKNVNESMFIMNNSLDKLQNTFDELAVDNYDWLLAMAGYVIRREYDSIINII